MIVIGLFLYPGINITLIVPGHCLDVKQVTRFFHYRNIFPVNCVLSVSKDNTSN